MSASSKRGASRAKLRCVIGVDVSYAKPMWLAAIDLKTGELQTWNVSEKMSRRKKHQFLEASFKQFAPSLIVAETSVVQFNRTTALRMAEWIGLLRSLSWTTGNLFCAVHPLSWQKRLLGQIPKGQTKIYSIRECKKYLKSVKTSRSGPLSDDEADAINIARFGQGNIHQLMRIEDD